MSNQNENEIFEDLFVLEAANNHWGDLDRGLKIIRDFGAIVRHNNVKAAIKFQFRDVGNFIHQDFSGNEEIRYIKKTEATAMAENDFRVFVDEVRSVGCIPMATPFDEASVDLCVAFGMPIIKVASSDINAWPLLEKIASTKLPVIISTGGATLKNIDDAVKFFENRAIPLAINHCVSLYPSEDSDLELNQIDFLKNRYPDHVIGFSTHEYASWEPSMFMSYAKGARTWERHIDIDYQGIPVSPYCSLPENVDVWFKAFHKAKEMSGGSENSRRIISKEETTYLDALVRGVYARRDLDPGYEFSQATFNDMFYLAVPLLKGQLSVREVMNGVNLTKGIKANEPLSVHHIDGPYNETQTLRDMISKRGL